MKLIVGVLLSGVLYCGSAIGAITWCDGTDPMQFIVDGDMSFNPSPIDIDENGILNKMHTMSFSGRLINPTLPKTQMSVTVYREDGTTSPCWDIGTQWGLGEPMMVGSCVYNLLERPEPVTFTKTLLVLPAGYQLNLARLAELKETVTNELSHAHISITEAGVEKACGDFYFTGEAFASLGLR